MTAMTMEPEWPAAPESEKLVLCRVLYDRADMAEVRAIDPEDFHDRRHQTIYAAALALFDEGDTLDVVTVADRLRATGQIEHAGGEEYLADLVDAVPPSADVAEHARIVRERAETRRIARSLNLTLREIAEGSADNPGEVSATVLSRLMEAQRQKAGSGYRAAEAFVLPALEALDEEVRKGKPAGASSVLPSLTRMTNGRAPGAMTVLAARPSMGKSALATLEALHAARKGQAVYFASLEMTADELTQRLLAQATGLDLSRIRRDGAKQHEWKAIAEAGRHIETLPLWIDDDPGSTVAEIRAGLHRAALAQPPDLIIVDYLQQMEGPGENRNQQVAGISRGLKRLAREFECHVLAVAQLSRGVERRDKPRPQLSDLRDSGAIEQDADNVLLLWRPEYYLGPDDPVEAWGKWQGRGELIVAKQRNGPTGTIDLLWDEASTRFSEPADERDSSKEPTWQP